jgi:hypothetical protein
MDWPGRSGAIWSILVSSLLWFFGHSFALGADAHFRAQCALAECRFRAQCRALIIHYTETA